MLKNKLIKGQKSFKQRLNLSIDFITYKMVDFMFGVSLKCKCDTYPSPVFTPEFTQLLSPGVNIIENNSSTIQIFALSYERYMSQKVPEHTLCKV